MKYQLKQHNFKIKSHISKEITTILADEDALIQALINLISNSIKYSKKNKIIIRGDIKCLCMIINVTVVKAKKKD